MPATQSPTLETSNSEQQQQQQQQYNSTKVMTLQGALVRVSVDDQRSRTRNWKALTVAGADKKRGPPPPPHHPPPRLCSPRTRLKRLVSIVTAYLRAARDRARRKTTTFYRVLLRRASHVPGAGVLELERRQSYKPINVATYFRRHLKRGPLGRARGSPARVLGPAPGPAVPC